MQKNAEETSRLRNDNMKSIMSHLAFLKDPLQQGQKTAKKKRPKHLVEATAKGDATKAGW